jgi:hypothetical protein
MFSIGAGNKPPSQFHIVANSNISAKQFNNFTEEQKKNFMFTMQNFGKYLAENFKGFLKAPMTKERNTIKIKEFSINLEIQPSKNSPGALHLDGYIYFNKYCLFDFKKLNDLWHSFVKAAGGKKGIINMVFMPDYLENTKKYSNKQGNTIFKL